MLPTRVKKYGLLGCHMEVNGKRVAMNPPKEKNKNKTQQKTKNNTSRDK